VQSDAIAVTGVAEPVFLRFVYLKTPVSSSHPRRLSTAAAHCGSVVGGQRVEVEVKRRWTAPSLGMVFFAGTF
jgi:hypothetical protein